MGNAGMVRPFPEGEVMKMTKEDVGEMKKMGAKKFIAHEKADIKEAKKGGKKKAGKKGKK